MNYKLFLLFLVATLMAALTGCTLSLAKPPASLPTTFVLPTLPPTNAAPPTDTPLAPPLASPTATPLTLPPVLPTLTPVSATTGPAVTPSGIIPGAPSGPYAVILVAPTDVLYIRSAAGAGNPTVGSFAATATNVMRTGPAMMVGDDLPALAQVQVWVQVQNPSGGGGWVNSYYLTEYISPTTFCADARVTTLLNNLDTALSTSNGDLLASLVSPSHGMDLIYLHTGTVANYNVAEASWVFQSTYVTNWGMHPASGLEVKGTFKDEVLPKLLDVFNASYTLNCNGLQTGGANYIANWPPRYANINFYALFKPGNPGIDLDWRTWLVGVEYVNGKPYVFAMLHLFWEP